MSYYFFLFVARELLKNGGCAGRILSLDLTSEQKQILLSNYFYCCERLEIFGNLH
jgi:hypothetical protein